MCGVKGDWQGPRVSLPGFLRPEAHFLCISLPGKAGVPVHSCRCAPLPTWSHDAPASREKSRRSFYPFLLSRPPPSCPFDFIGF